jgi:hypothetical protein
MTRCAWRWTRLSPIALALAVPAYAGSWGLKPGEWSSTFQAGAFTASSWHDDDGERSPLFGGGTIEERTLTAINELGWRRNLTFVLGVPAKSVTRRGTALPIQESATGLGDALIGLRYQLANGGVALALQADWKAPLGYDRHLLATHQDSVLSGDASGNGDSLDVVRLRQTSPPRLGEGQQDLGLALALGLSLPRLHGYLEASGGYRYRFDEPADQIVGGAEFGVWVTRSLLIAGRYQGEMAVGDGNLPEDAVDRHRAGPRIVYRVDDGLDLIAGSLHTAQAHNALHTDEIYVGLAFKQSSLSRYQGALGTRRSP